MQQFFSSAILVWYILLCVVKLHVMHQYLCTNMSTVSLESHDIEILVLNINS